MGPRTIGVLILAAVLLALAAFVFLQDSGAGAKKVAPEKGTTGKSPADLSLPSTGHAGAAASRTGRREKTGPTKMPSRLENAIELEPIVARGRVILPAGLKLDGLEVLLHTASGEELSSADPDDSGRYELRSDSFLLPGWTISTAWTGIHPSSGALVGKTFAKAFRRIAEPHAPTAPPVDCDLAVGEAVKFQGKVTERATGKPIQGATVQVFSGLPAWRENSAEETTTDGEGKYQLSLEDLPSDELVVCCRADDFQAESAGPVDVPVGTTRSQDFALAAAITFSGRVVDDATGQPIPRASVAFCPDDYSLRSDRAQEMTDDSGVFSVEVKDVAIERGSLRIECKGFAAAKIAGRKCHENMEVRLGKSVVIAGKVRDREGKAVGGARVDFALADEWSWDDPNYRDSARTAGDGSFQTTLESVPSEGVVVLVDFYPPYRLFLAPLESIQTKGSSATTREVEIVLDPAEAPESKPNK
jgi:hypothetical protein